MCQKSPPWTPRPFPRGPPNRSQTGPSPSTRASQKRRLAKCPPGPLGTAPGPLLGIPGDPQGPPFGVDSGTWVPSSKHRFWTLSGPCRGRPWTLSRSNLHSKLVHNLNPLQCRSCARFGIVFQKDFGCSRVRSGAQAGPKNQAKKVERVALGQGRAWAPSTDLPQTVWREKPSQTFPRFPDGMDFECWDPSQASSLSPLASLP